MIDVFTDEWAMIDGVVLKGVGPINEDHPQQREPQLDFEAEDPMIEFYVASDDSLEMQHLSIDDPERGIDM